MVVVNTDGGVVVKTRRVGAGVVVVVGLGLGFCVGLGDGFTGSGGAPGVEGGEVGGAQAHSSL